jgi:hypothetical protein
MMESKSIFRNTTRNQMFCRQLEAFETQIAMITIAQVKRVGREWGRV